MTAERRRDALRALVAVALSVPVTFALWRWSTYRLTVGSAGFAGVGDDHVYRFMTAHPVGSFHIAPFCWRIGVPALVRYLPVRPQTGYQAVALVSVSVTGVLVYLIARRWGFARWLSLLGLLLFFSFAYATKFNLKDFWLTDAPAFAFASGAVLAMQYRRRFVFAALLLLGVFAKESVIFVAPLAYTFTARRGIDGRAFARACLLGLPAVAALLALRLAIPAWNADPSYVAALPASVRSDIGNLPSYSLWFVARSTLAARSHVWLQTIGDTVSSFGLLPMVVPWFGLDWSRAGRTGRRLSLPGRGDLREVLVLFWPLLVLDVVQLVFAFNTQRLVVFAFLPVVLGCLVGVHVATQRWSVPAGWFALAAAVAVGLEFAQPAQSSPTTGLQVATFGALLVLVAGTVALRRTTVCLRTTAWLRTAGSRRPVGVPGVTGLPRVPASSEAEDRQ